MEKDSKIYVAGHRGLVGSAIWKNLEGKGYRNLVGMSHAELDLLDGQAVKAFFDREAPEYVVLAAAHVGGIMANNRYRADFIYQNLQIQQNVIGESFRHGVKKLLFLGSTCIYPREAPQPMREDCLLTSPLEYTNEPYVYGPNDSFHLENSHVMPAMIRKVFLGKCLMEKNEELLRADMNARPVEGVDGKNTLAEIEKELAKFGIYRDKVVLWGTGSPMREFLWSEEMADASVYVLEHVDFKDTYKAGEHEVRNCHINIGTGKEISIRNLAHLVATAVGYEGEICFDATKPDGTPRKLTDPSKLHALGWRHKIDVEEGVGKLFAWYKANL